MSIKSIEDLVRKIKSIKINKRVCQKVGEETKKMIVERTIKGIGADKGKQKRFKKLKKNTIKQRKKTKAEGNMSPLTTPRKSNMIETGELLNSITLKADSKGFEIFPKGKENQAKAEGNQDLGRKIFDTTVRETNKIKEMFEEEILKEFNKK